MAAEHDHRRPGAELRDDVAQGRRLSLGRDDEVHLLAAGHLQRTDRLVRHAGYGMVMPPGSISVGRKISPGPRPG